MNLLLKPLAILRFFEIETEKEEKEKKGQLKHWLARERERLTLTKIIDSGYKKIKKWKSR